MLVLGAHPLRQIEQRAEASFQRHIAINLAADVADDPAKSRPQELELAPGALELMSVGIAADHDGGALGQAQIALSSGTRLRLANPTSLVMARCISRASVGCATAFGCTVVSTATRSRSLGPMAPVLCANDRLSWISATSCSSPSRWRQRVIDDRSNGSRWQKINSPQKYW